MPVSIGGSLGETLYSGVAARAHGQGDGLQYDSGPEYRSVGELRAASLRMTGLPVVLGHKGRKVGEVVAAIVHGGEMVAQMRVDDAGRKAIDAGVVELSIGYRAEVDARRYQQRIEPFELAIVDRGRCGSTCRIETRQDCKCDEGERVPARPDAAALQRLATGNSRDAIGRLARGEAAPGALDPRVPATSLRDVWKAPLPSTVRYRSRGAAIGGVR